MRRPNPLQWLWYAIGGRLPMRYRDWVFHDLTRRTWLRGFTLRSMLQVTPLVLVIFLGLVLLLDAPAGLAIASAALGLIVGVYFSLSYAVESTENRISKYGYPRGAAGEARKEATAAENAQRQATYDARYRATDDQRKFGNGQV